MNKQSKVNKIAWSYRAYEFWTKYNGKPADVAQDMIESPRRWLKRHIDYLGDIDGKKIANLLGSNGRKAVPLALLGAEVIVIDISPDNEKYAMELSREAGGKLILNDAHPIRKIIKINNEESVLEDNYFDSSLIAGDVAYKSQFPLDEQENFPDCLLRYWTMGEIVTALASAGFVMQRLVEEPRSDAHKEIPGTFTIIAVKNNTKHSSITSQNGKERTI